MSLDRREEDSGKIFQKVGKYKNFTFSLILD